MWWLRETRGRVEFGFTDRRGGVSEGGYASLNLAHHTGDDAGRVAANRSRVAADLGAGDLVTVNQIHGNIVRSVSRLDEELEAADALMTTVSGLPIAVLAADCVPVVLVSERAAAVVHAGRAGLAAGVVETAIESVRGLGAASIEAVIGPRVCGRCYEVPEIMAEEVAALYSAARSTTRTGTSALDLGAGVRQAAEAAGAVAYDPAAGVCTLEDDAFFSHRGAGPATGRCAAVAVLR